MAVTANTHVAVPETGSAGGLPQFDTAMWPGQMVWILLIFVVLYFLFARVFVPRIAGAIDQREDKISGDIGEARRLRDEARAAAAAAAGELAQVRAQALKLAADAQAEAKAHATARQAAEEAKLAQVLASAEARIAEARGEAMSHVRAIAVETTSAIITRLTGAEASAGELTKAVDAAAATAS
jgi:F-type H+-transporting ATPase subunit b